MRNLFDTRIILAIAVLLSLVAQPAAANKAADKRAGTRTGARGPNRLKVQPRPGLSCAPERVPPPSTLGPSRAHGPGSGSNGRYR